MCALYYNMNIHSIPKSHLFTNDDIHLYELPQVFSISSVWYQENMSHFWTTYDVVVREMPKRNFLLFTGLEEVLKNILNWRYNKKEVDLLLKMKIITPQFAKYMLKFKFTGDVSALPEGSIFFPGEPIIRISAPMVEGNLLTMLLMNVVSSNTIFSTKAIRCVIAAGDKKLIGPFGMRAHSYESSMKCARSAYIAGSTVGAPSFFMKYGVDPKKISTVIIGYHAFIKSFDNELQAMRTVGTYSPYFINTSVMVDTYEPIQGIKNAIITAKEMEKRGERLTSITIDNGDLYALTVRARKMLNAAGLRYIKIVIASNLDEYKIYKFMKRKIPADTFIIATEGVTVADAPKLEVVYKMAEIRTDSGIKYQAKLAKGKESYPGLKNIYRKYKNGVMKEDVIGLEGEKLGHPLLKQYIKNGKLVADIPGIEEVRKKVKREIKRLPKKLLDIEKTHHYPVKISKKLLNLFNKVKKHHLNHT